MVNKKIINSNYEYLEGPNSRGNELSFSLKVFWQLLKGFRSLHFVGPCITVFGSARFNEEHPEYIEAMQIGRLIANLGFTTMTGGGPGIMEATNRGAKEAGGYSVGCNIKLPHEQKPNNFLDKYVLLDHFFVRKVLLLKYSYAFIVMPGGFGTLDELFETITLIQTGIIEKFPVVVIGKEYYTHVRELIDLMLKEETISASDRILIKFTDDSNEAIDHIINFIANNYKVQSKSTKPIWWLGENNVNKRTY